MNLPKAIISQYLASLDMLEQAISKCPQAIWNRAGDKAKFWHLAYHALFYTHLYLQDSEQSFVPWTRHREDYQYLAPPSWRTHVQHIGELYTKEDLLEYLAFCRQQVIERVPRLNLEVAPGFDWLPFSKLELQIYNIRHLQQHTGELMERLGAGAGVEIHWVAMKQG